MTGFSFLDWFVVAAYLLAVVWFGIRMGGRQASAHDFFFSDKRIPSWGVALAVVATETSSLTFLSIPGLAYAGNWTFLELALGYVIGRIFVAWFLLPRYFEGELTTAYALMEKRFGPGMRKTTSIVFMGTRVVGDGVRLFATAIPITLILKGHGTFAGLSDGWIYGISIVITGILTMAYVHVGGVRAVIWTDIVQFFLYLGGALAAVILLVLDIPDLRSGLDAAWAAGKMKLLSLDASPLSDPYHALGAVTGGIFLSMASHGTDQIIVQRLFAAGERRGAGRALIASGIIVFVQFLLFLFLGTLLYLFYGPGKMRGDEVFSKFIVEEMPSGLSGLIVAAVLAAAMSTLSGSVSALASTVTYDFYAATPRGQRATDVERLRFSRFVSLLWGIVLTASALAFIGTGKAVVEVALGVASFTYGGLLGVFLLGAFFRRVTSAGAVGGFVCGTIFLGFLVVRGGTAWTLYTPAGALVTVVTALLWAAVSRRSEHP